jgi:hypothetical protein
MYVKCLRCCCCCALLSRARRWTRSLLSRGRVALAPTPAQSRSLSADCKPTAQQRCRSHMTTVRHCACCVRVVAFVLFAHNLALGTTWRTAFFPFYTGNTTQADYSIVASEVCIVGVCACVIADVCAERSWRHHRGAQRARLCVRLVKHHLVRCCDACMGRLLCGSTRTLSCV